MMKISKFMWIVIAFVILIAVGAGLSMFFGRKREGMTTDGGGGDLSKTVEAMFFFADWCPHCQKAKPEWQSAKAEKEGAMLPGGYRMKMMEVDCTNGKNPEIQQYQIKGYPTILVKKDGQITLFEQSPTKDNLIQFLNSF